jgi:hypothetical protein
MQTRFDILAAMKLRLCGAMKEARATNYIIATRFRGSDINFLLSRKSLGILPPILLSPDSRSHEA